MAVMELPRSRKGLSALEVASQAVTEAGEIILAHFRSPQKTKLKGRGNLVTEADLLSEKAIKALLRAEYPEHSIISEESEAIPADSAYTWIIDPLDGTNNYSFGLPFFAVTLALTYEEEALLGVTYDPLRQELFRAEKGGGAFLNNSPLSVSQRTEIRRSLIAFDIGYDAERGRQMLTAARDLWPGMHSLRVLGSAALGLAYVAAGRIDIYLHRCLYPWDVAAGILLVREAGGLVTDWEENHLALNAQEVVAANPVLHRELMALFGL